jgi:hypothetical protein
MQWERANWGRTPLFFSLLRKNAPWIRHVFLVTDNQRPAWLTDGLAAELDITLVDHTVIFRDLESYLPTFSSRSIETVIHRIPGLSEQFLYLNNDVFLIKPIAYSDLFGESVVKPRGRVIFRVLKLRRKINQTLSIGKRGYCGYRGGPHNALSRFRVFTKAHAPLPLLRLQLAALFDLEFIHRNLSYSFREPSQIQPLNVFYNQGIRRCFVSLGVDDWAYLVPAEYCDTEVAPLLSSVNDDARVKTLCVQSLSDASSVKRQAILQFLSKLL